MTIAEQRAAAVEARTKALRDAEIHAKQRAPTLTTHQKAVEEADRVSASFERIVDQSETFLRESARPEIAATIERFERVWAELRRVVTYQNNEEITPIAKDLLDRIARLRELHLEGDISDLAARLDRDTREVLASVEPYMHRAAVILGPTG